MKRYTQDLVDQKRLQTGSRGNNYQSNEKNKLTWF